LCAATAGLAAFVVISNFGPNYSTGAPREPGSAPRPVVVELFTSEGCSSCPPADALLKQLSERQSVQGAQIIALEEHVDDWNHLGWQIRILRSSSRSAKATMRRFLARTVFTRPMVVDGQREFVGSRSLAAKEAIEKAANQPKVR